MEQQTPQTKAEAARRAKTRHFPIIDLKFSIYFVQDCSREGLISGGGGGGIIGCISLFTGRWAYN